MLECLIFLRADGKKYFKKSTETISPSASRTHVQHAMTFAMVSFFLLNYKCAGLFIVPIIHTIPSIITIVIGFHICSEKNGDVLVKLVA